MTGQSPDDGGATDAPDPGTDDRTFDAPWQARAFALAVALTKEADGETLTWEEFQSRLVEEVEEGTGDDAPDQETAYYRQWLTALERLLVDRDLLDPGELLKRVNEFASGDRDAHEFVAGDPHAHADDLPVGHAEGSHSHGGHSHGHEGGPPEHDDGGHGHDDHDH